MADNVPISAGTGTSIATDDVGGVHYQIVKPAFGALDTATLVSAANPLPITGTVNAGTGVADVTASGSLAALNATVALALGGGYSGAVVQITGTWVGTIQFEGTAEGANWLPINGVFAGSSAPGPTVTANGIIRLTPAGLAQIRVNMTAFTSGSAVITLRASQGAGGTFLNQSLTVGSNIIGRVGEATDVGRVIRHFIFDTPTATPSAETLASVTQWYNNAAVAGTTTPAVVPAGKTLRLMGARLNTASLAAAGMVVMRIRVNTAGLVAVTSPLVGSLQCGSPAVAAALMSEQIINFPKGIDIPSGAGVGFTHQGYVGATATLQSFTRFEVWGYEFTT